MTNKHFLKSLHYPKIVSSRNSIPLSVSRWVEHFERNLYNTNSLDGLTAQCPSENRTMLFLRIDQTRELLRAAQTMREKLIIRYFLLNGLSPMELRYAQLEHLNPVDCTLFLPKRHWKKNCLTDIDAETVKLQIVYAGDRVEGPLIPGRYGKALKHCWLWHIVKEVAMRTNIASKEKVSPIILKRTFARLWLLSGGNVGTLQKQFSHKHLWSTAHYLRFVMEDVKPDHKRMLKHTLEAGQ